MYTPHKTSSRRVEVRSPDSACNPYLTFAVLLAAGLRGVEKGYVLGPQAEDNVWDLTPEERRAMGYRELPSSLDSALRAMEPPNSSRRPWGSTFLTFLAQQAHGVGELPQPRHAIRAAHLPVAVAQIYRLIRRRRALRYRRGRDQTRHAAAEVAQRWPARIS